MADSPPQSTSDSGEKSKKESKNFDPVLYQERFQTILSYKKFIEDVIHSLKVSNDISRRPQLVKMEMLHKVLYNPNKILKLKTIRRCENVLKGLKQKIESAPQILINDKLDTLSWIGDNLCSSAEDVTSDDNCNEPNEEENTSNQTKKSCSLDATNSESDDSSNENSEETVITKCSIKQTDDNILPCVSSLPCQTLQKTVNLKSSIQVDAFNLPNVNKPKAIGFKDHQQKRHESSDNSCLTNIESNLATAKTTLNSCTQKDVCHDKLWSDVKKNNHGITSNKVDSPENTHEVTSGKVNSPENMNREITSDKVLNSSKKIDQSEKVKSPKKIEHSDKVKSQKKIDHSDKVKLLNKIVHEITSDKVDPYKKIAHEVPSGKSHSPKKIDHVDKVNSFTKIDHETTSDKLDSAQNISKSTTLDTNHGLDNSTLNLHIVQTPLLETGLPTQKMPIKGILKYNHKCKPYALEDTISETSRLHQSDKESISNVDTFKPSTHELSMKKIDLQESPNINKKDRLNTLKTFSEAISAEIVEMNLKPTCNLVKPISPVHTRPMSLREKLSEEINTVHKVGATNRANSLPTCDNKSIPSTRMLNLKAGTIMDLINEEKCQKSVSLKSRQNLKKSNDEFPCFMDSLVQSNFNSVQQNINLGNTNTSSIHSETEKNNPLSLLTEMKPEELKRIVNDHILKIPVKQETENSQVIGEQNLGTTNYNHPGDNYSGFSDYNYSLNSTYTETQNKAILPPTQSGLGNRIPVISHHPTNISPKSNNLMFGQYQNQTTIQTDFDARMLNKFDQISQYNYSEERGESVYSNFPNNSNSFQNSGINTLDNRPNRNQLYNNNTSNNYNSSDYWNSRQLSYKQNSIISNFQQCNTEYQRFKWQKTPTSTSGYQSNARINNYKNSDFYKSRENRYLGQQIRSGPQMSPRDPRRKSIEEPNLDPRRRSSDEPNLDLRRKNIEEPNEKFLSKGGKPIRLKEDKHMRYADHKVYKEDRVKEDRRRDDRVKDIYNKKYSLSRSQFRKRNNQMSVHNHNFKSSVDKLYNNKDEHACEKSNGLNKFKIPKLKSKEKITDDSQDNCNSRNSNTICHKNNSQKRKIETIVSEQNDSEEEENTIKPTKIVKRNYWKDTENDSEEGEAMPIKINSDIEKEDNFSVTKIVNEKEEMIKTLDVQVVQESVVTTDSDFNEIEKPSETTEKILNNESNEKESKSPNNSDILKELCKKGIKEMPNLDVEDLIAKSIINLLEKDNQNKIIDKIIECIDPQKLKFKIEEQIQEKNQQELPSTSMAGCLNKSTNQELNSDIKISQEVETNNTTCVDKESTGMLILTENKDNDSKLVENNSLVEKVFEHTELKSRNVKKLAVNNKKKKGGKYKKKKGSKYKIIHKHINDKSKEVNSLDLNKKPKKKQKNELEKLQEDIRDMFISSEVIAATGIRKCRKRLLHFEDDSPVKNKRVIKKKLHNKNRPLTNTNSSNESEDILLEETTSSKSQTELLKDDVEESHNQNNKSQNDNEVNSTSVTTNDALDTKFNSLKLRIKRLPLVEGLNPISVLNQVNTKQESDSNNENKNITNMKCKKKNTPMEINDELDNMIDSPKDLKKSSNYIAKKIQNKYRPYKYKKSTPPTTLFIPVKLNANVEDFQDSEDKRFKCYYCEITRKSTTMVRHYVTEHPDVEVMISRLSAESAKQAQIEASKYNFYQSPTDYSVTSTHYKCRMCTRQFLDKLVFFDHLALHTGEYRYQCKICNYSTSSKSGLRTHLKSSHKITKQDHLIISLYENDKNYNFIIGYLCTSCHFVQLQKDRVDNHIQNNHSFHAVLPEVIAINMAITNDLNETIMNDVDQTNNIKLESENVNFHVPHSVTALNIHNSIEELESFEIKRECTAEVHNENKDSHRAVIKEDVPEELTSDDGNSVYSLEEPIDEKNKRANSTQELMAKNVFCVNSRTVELASDEHFQTEESVMKPDLKVFFGDEVVNDKYRQNLEREKIMKEKVEGNFASHKQPKAYNNSILDTIQNKLCSFHSETKSLDKNSIEDVKISATKSSFSQSMIDFSMESHSTTKHTLPDRLCKEKSQLNLDTSFSDDEQDYDNDRDTVNSEAHLYKTNSSTYTPNINNIIQRLENNLTTPNSLASEKEVPTQDQNLEDVSSKTIAPIFESQVIPKPASIRVRRLSGDKLSTAPPSRNIVDNSPLNVLSIDNLGTSKTSCSIDNRDKTLHYTGNEIPINQQSVNLDNETPPTVSLGDDQLSIIPPLNHNTHNPEIAADPLEVIDLCDSSNELESSEQLEDNTCDFLRITNVVSLQNDNMFLQLETEESDIRNSFRNSSQQEENVDSRNNVIQCEGISNANAKCTNRVTQNKNVVTPPVKRCTEQNLYEECSNETVTQSNVEKVSNQFTLKEQFIPLSHLLDLKIKQNVISLKRIPNKNNKKVIANVIEISSDEESKEPILKTSNSNLTSNDQYINENIAISEEQADYINDLKEMEVDGVNFEISPTLNTSMQQNSCNEEIEQETNCDGTVKLRNEDLKLDIGVVLDLTKPLKCVQFFKCAYSFQAMLGDEKLGHFYKCMGRKCSFTTNNNEMMLKHYEEHADDKNTTGSEMEWSRCPYCYKKAESSLDYFIHMRKGHGNSNYQCVYCFYRSTSANNVVGHQSSCHRGKDAIVLECLQQFPKLPTSPASNKVQLDYYKCAQNKKCDFSTFIQDMFRTHLEIKHKLDKTFSCFKCSGFTSQIDRLIRHFELHGIKYYQCLHCSHGSTSCEEMHQHLINKHPNEDPFSAKRCKSDHAIEGAFVSGSLEKLNMISFRNFNLRPHLIIPAADESQSKATQNTNKSLNTHTSQNHVNNITQDNTTSKPFCTIASSENLDKSSHKILSSILSVNSINSSKTESRLAKETIVDEVEVKDKVLESKPNLISSATGVRITRSSNETAAHTRSNNITDKQLTYICGAPGCSSQYRNLAELKIHFQECTHISKSTIFQCPHCLLNNITSPSLYFDHLKAHVMKRFFCSFCSFKWFSSDRVTSHMRSRHKIRNVTMMPRDPKKNNKDLDNFVIIPKLEAEEQTVTTKCEEVQTKFSVDEIDKIPLPAVSQIYLGCNLCSFKSKVRSNLVQHLSLHAAGFNVPQEELVNPVPCLEKNEKMFDKMMNLASSSNKQHEKAMLLKCEDNKYPKYVPSNYRFKCHAAQCSYSTTDGVMLKNHIIHLHAEETRYCCPHCPQNDVPDIITLDNLIFHLKLHDGKLYGCTVCNYCNYSRHRIQEHIKSHDNGSAYMKVIRELDTDIADIPRNIKQSLDPAPIASTSQPKHWCCCLCKYRSSDEGLARKHIKTIHGMDFQYKCKLCPFGTDLYSEFDHHFVQSHHGFPKEIIVVYKNQLDLQSSTNSNNDLQVQNTYWRRKSHPSHIRGIQVGDDKKNGPISKKVPCIPSGPYGSPINNMFVCPKCNLLLKGNVEFIQHMYKEFSFDPWYCALCSKTSSKRHEIVKHIKAKHKTHDIDIDEIVNYDITSETYSWVLAAMTHQSSLMETLDKQQPSDKKKTVQSSSNTKEGRRENLK